MSDTQTQPLPENAPVDPNAQPTGAPTPPKSKLQLLADFQKTLEKNGYKIDNTVIENLISSIQSGESTLKNFSFKFSIGDTPTQKIKVFPRGKYFFEKYGETFDFNDKFFNEVIQSFKSDKLFKPYMDIDHKLEEKVADIKDLTIENDGLYAEIELNTTGMELIKNNKYSYISPEWGDRIDNQKTLHKNALWAITLTNIPAFEGTLSRLQDQIKLSKTGGTKMYDKEKLISLKAKCDTYKLQGEVDPNKLMPLIEEMLKMFDEMKAKIEEATGQAQQAQDQQQQAVEQATALKKQIEQKEMDDYFEDSVKLGKIDVSEVENMKRLYTLDKETVKNTISLRKGKEDYQLSGSGSTSNRLTKEDYYIMENLGYDRNDPKSVALYLKSQE